VFISLLFKKPIIAEVFVAEVGTARVTVVCIGAVGMARASGFTGDTAAAAVVPFARADGAGAARASGAACGVAANRVHTI
jgi:hypothetical protein